MPENFKIDIPKIEKAIGLDKDVPNSPVWEAKTALMSTLVLNRMRAGMGRESFSGTEEDDLADALISKAANEGRTLGRHEADIEVERIARAINDEIVAQVGRAPSVF